MNEALRETGTFEQEATRLRQLKDALDLANADAKSAESAYKDQCQTVLDLMDAQGISATKIPGVASLSVTAKDVAVAEDWQQIYDWALENQMLHIFQRRLSSTAVDELAGQGIEIPGIGHMHTKTLNVRKA